MNKTLRYFSLWYLQAVGVIAAACAGFAVGALLEIRSSGAGLLSTYLSSVPIMVLLLSLIMPYTLSRSYAEEALCFGAAPAGNFSRAGDGHDAVCAGDAGRVHGR